MSGTAQTFNLMMIMLLGLGAIYFQLLPMQFEADAAVQPDLLLVLLMSWTIRRPETAPLIVVAALLLIADLALDRPAGLWALLSLIMYEFLRGQRPAIVDRPFMVEWATVAIVYAVALAVREVVLSLALVPTADLSDLLMLYAVTLGAYPLVAAFLHFVLRVRPPQPKEKSQRLGRVR